MSLAITIFFFQILCESETEKMSIAKLSQETLKHENSENSANEIIAIFINYKYIPIKNEKITYRVGTKLQ